MKGLRLSAAVFERVDLPDADVQLMAKFPMPQSDDRMFDSLEQETHWRQDKVFVWGRWHDQPRLTAWHGDPGKSYSYSGTRMTPRPWTDLLLSIKRTLEDLVEAQFNSVLLNLYRNQDDRMGFHSDDEPSLGREPTIASLSYGATRTLIFKHKTDKLLGRRRVALPSASLLVMRGRSQHCWLHGIDRETRPCGPRINLTFRNIIAPS